MAVTLHGRRIEKVGVVDDSPDAREGYTYAICDAELEPLMEEGPLPPLKTFAESVAAKTDAVLCDHHLRVKAYSPFNGAELAAKCYSGGHPAILCTLWEGANLDDIRRFRPEIPVLMKPVDLNPESLLEGLAEVLLELEQGPGPHRRAWRTQIVVADTEDGAGGGRVYVQIPGWHSDEIISLPRSDIATAADLKAGSRVHARVNIGAERPEDLFFTDWEPE